MIFMDESDTEVYNLSINLRNVCQSKKKRKERKARAGFIPFLTKLIPGFFKESRIFFQEVYFVF